MATLRGRGLSNRALRPPPARATRDDMAFIATVPPAGATGETRDVYRYMREVGGAAMIGQIVQLFSVRPSSMRRMIRSWELAMWCGSEPRPPREFLAASISRLNECHY